MTLEDNLTPETETLFRSLFDREWRELSDESPPGSAELLCSLVWERSKKSDCAVTSDHPSVTLRARHRDMDDDTASEGVEVIVLEDEDFREMFSGTVDEEKIEHCMSRVSLQDHDYNKTREILQVK